jgi:hypothetical protein
MYGEEAEKYGIDNASPLSAAALGTLSGASDLVLGGEGMILSKFAKASVSLPPKRPRRLLAVRF